MGAVGHYMINAGVVDFKAPVDAFFECQVTHPVPTEPLRHESLIAILEEGEANSIKMRFIIPGPFMTHRLISWIKSKPLLCRRARL